MMIKTDLIAGFLGCGKTTFIRRYTKYLEAQGIRFAIIENEFGGVNVDSLMLKDEPYEISEISGGCMCCTAKVAFQDTLRELAKKDYDRIIVEPSGIYDADEFLEVMLSEPVKSVCEIGNILTIVDADFSTETLSDEARYLMFSQLVPAGKLILSKSQLTSSETAKRTLDGINRIMEHYGCSRRFLEDVCAKDWAALTEEDLADFLQCGFHLLDHRREFMQHGNVFTARAMAHLCAGPDDLRQRLARLMSDPSYGNILRIKGHIADMDRNWYEINCSLDGLIYIKPVNVRMGLFIVIGQDLNEEAIHGAFIPRGNSARKKTAGQTA